MTSFKRIIICFALRVLQCCAKRNLDDVMETIAGYQPQNDLTNLLSIDMDQAAMSVFLQENQDNSLQNAFEIYTKGSYALSVATLELNYPLAMNIPSGTTAVGKTQENNDVHGTIYQDSLNGEKVLYFQYNVLRNQTERCFVGDLDVSDQILSGCLAHKGKIIILSRKLVLEYRYDPYIDNTNGLTMQSLSQLANKNFYECQTCPYPDFLKFRSYYGRSNYANEWILAAFEGRSSQLINGNVNFRDFSSIGRHEAIKKGTVFLTFWMFVVGLTEQAVSLCESGCTDCNSKSVRAWDEAVALYTGSLEGPDGSGKGELLYELADKRCITFRTCGPESNSNSGTSAVNLKVFALFQETQLGIANGKCIEAMENKRRIINLMKVPLLQGTIHYAYINEKQKDSTGKQQAIGSAFAASILPFLHHCNSEDANTVWKVMMSAERDASVNFRSVKEALERNFNCMEVTCEELGGIFDSGTRSYFPDTHPCKNRYMISPGTNIGDIFAVLLIAMFFVVVMSCLTCCCLPLRRRKILKKGAEMPPLEVSQAIQEAEYQMQLEEEYTLQLQESEKRQQELENQRKLKAQEDSKSSFNMSKKSILDDSRISKRKSKPYDEEELTMLPPNVKSLASVFENGFS